VLVKRYFYGFNIENSDIKSEQGGARFFPERYVKLLAPGESDRKLNQMKETIKHLNPGDEFYTSERCYINELSNTSDDPDVSIARARLEPGVTTRWHRLRDTVERYCIIEGSGCVEIGSLPPQSVSAGDVVLIPPMCRQRMTNTGSEDLIFLAICTPRFSNDVYEDIEDEQE
jgi:mannose-6-phosphate isomerase-like protein (cupin superfamily)